MHKDTDKAGNMQACPDNVLSKPPVFSREYCRIGEKE